MGFDLVAKRPSHPGASYLRVDIFQMIFLRSTMLAAGVSEILVNRKFLGNDNYLVTPLQCAVIAKKLKIWLKGRNLVIDLVDQNKRAREVTTPCCVCFRL